MRHRKPASPPAGTRSSAVLRRDARALYLTMTALIRFYQFRDRNRAVRHGLTVGQCYVLDILRAPGALPVTTVAHALRLDKSTASRIIQGMLRKGLLQAVPDPGDARLRRVMATRDARRRYARVVRDLEADNRELLAGFSPGVRRRLLAFVHELLQRALARDREADAPGP